MGRRFPAFPALLAGASCLLLTGCATLLERSYSVVEPYTDRYWDSSAEDTLRAENYQELVNTLLLLVEERAEEGVVRFYNTGTNTLRLVQNARREVQEDTVLGSYLLSNMTFVLQGEEEFCLLTFHMAYREGTEDVDSLMTISDTQSLTDLLRLAVREGLETLTARFVYETPREDIAEAVETLWQELSATEGTEETGETGGTSGETPLPAAFQNGGDELHPAEPDALSKGNGENGNGNENTGTSLENPFLEKDGSIVTDGNNGTGSDNEINGNSKTGRNSETGGNDGTGEDNETGGNDGTGGDNETGGNDGTGEDNETGGNGGTGGDNETGGNDGTGEDNETGGNGGTGEDNETGGNDGTGGDNEAGGSDGTGGDNETDGSDGTGGNDETGGNDGTGGNSETDGDSGTDENNPSNPDNPSGGAEPVPVKEPPPIPPCPWKICFYPDQKTAGIVEIHLPATEESVTPP